MSTQDQFTPTMPGGVFDQKAVDALLEDTDTSAWIYELTLQDRCDRCGAQAFGAALIVTRDETGAVKEVPLLFCGHHLNAHSVALEVQATAIVDHTHRINEKPSSSSGTEMEH